MASGRPSRSRPASISPIAFVKTYVSCHPCMRARSRPSSDIRLPTHASASAPASPCRAASAAKRSAEVWASSISAKTSSSGASGRPCSAAMLRFHSKGRSEVRPSRSPFTKAVDTCR